MNGTSKGMEGSISVTALVPGSMRWQRNDGFFFSLAKIKFFGYIVYCVSL